jgi:hypothetical protein
VRTVSNGGPVLALFALQVRHQRWRNRMPRAQVAEISAERVAELKAKPVLSYHHGKQMV